MRRAKLCVLGSGRGTNYEAIAQAIAESRLAAEVVLVISDVADSGILQLAKERGDPAKFLPPGPKRTVLSAEAEAAYVDAVQQSRADLVILAGFMRVLKPGFLSQFPERVLNIHPSLLPAFPGLRAWEQALHAGVQEAGCTVHLVNEAVDAGPVVAQERVPVLPEDDAATLHARIQEAEHRLYPQAIEMYWKGFTGLR